MRATHSFRDVQRGGQGRVEGCTSIVHVYLSGRGAWRFAIIISGMHEPRLNRVWLWFLLFVSLQPRWDQLIGARWSAQLLDICAHNQPPPHSPAHDEEGNVVSKQHKR